jgi:amino acid adenylation domain-containing protein
MLDRNLYALFADQTKARLDAVAVVESKTATTSYRQLAARAAQVAAFLQAEGVQAEEPVGVMMSRTPEMIAVLLGILKCGAAYVPIDPDDPPERRRVIIEQSGCRLVIAHRARIQSLRSAAVVGDALPPGLRLIDVDHIPAVTADPFSDIAPGGARLAYILFTSGSTGQPKGVEVEHRSVVNLLMASRNLIDFTADDCLLAVSTIGFDISVVELFLPLITGGSILLRDRAALLEPTRLAADIREHGVTVVQTGPSTWSVLLAEVPDFPTVRVAIATAEAISVGRARDLVNHGEQVWNLYGPTETTIWSTGYRITRDNLERDHHSAVSVPIGLPLVNTELLIVDDARRTVPDGAEGELYISGIGVARGYRGNPELTAERFVIIDGERYYRTGDVVSWSRDGYLLYHGRNDDQMKIRGVRIDPAEVESAIRSHPQVAHTAATWYPAPGGLRSIVAAVVGSNGTPPSASELHAWLRNRLSDTMIPSRFVFCEELPYTPSGKIDRVAIRGMSNTAPEVSLFESNASSTEQRLIDIWRRVLQEDRIGPDDHFFTVGGDSLAAVRVLSQVEESFGLVLPVQTIFRKPVLRDFAAELDRMSKQRGLGGLLMRVTRWWHSRHISEKRNIPAVAPIHAVKESGDIYAPVTDTALILPKQHTYVDTWQGFRRTPDSLVVSLNEHGTAQGIFWCLQGYRELSQLAGHIGDTFPVHGMRSGYLIIQYDNTAHVETLATRYAEEIMLVQPNGPLVLGGNCQGGVIMRAVADHLISLGREIRLLILMEQSRFKPYAGSVMLVFGRDSHLNPYLKLGADPDERFRTNFPGGYEVAFIDGAHGQFFESPNIESLAATLTCLLTATPRNHQLVEQNH